MHGNVDFTYHGVVHPPRGLFSVSFGPAKVPWFQLLKLKSAFVDSLVEGAIYCSVEVLSPFLTGRMFVRRTYFGHFDELRFVS